MRATLRCLASLGVQPGSRRQLPDRHRPTTAPAPATAARSSGASPREGAAGGPTSVRTAET
jgi:hypothetical protein